MGAGLSESTQRGTSGEPRRGCPGRWRRPASQQAVSTQQAGDERGGDAQAAAAGLGDAHRGAGEGEAEDAERDCQHGQGAHEQRQLRGSSCPGRACRRRSRRRPRRARPGSSAAGSRGRPLRRGARRPTEPPPRSPADLPHCQRRRGTALRAASSGWSSAPPKPSVGTVSRVGPSPALSTHQRAAHRRQRIGRTRQRHRPRQGLGTRPGAGPADRDAARSPRDSTPAARDPSVAWSHGKARRLSGSCWPCMPTSSP